VNKPKLPPWLAVIFLRPPTGLSAQPSDESLTGCPTSILERELHWDRRSHRLEIRQGLATLALKEDDPERRARQRGVPEDR
jgi:hypothetical protein